MSGSLQVLHRGAKSDAARALQAATNRRLRARDIHELVVQEDGLVGNRTLAAVRKAAWALGAQSSTYEAILRTGEIPVGVQRMILNPGKRTPGQQAIARARMSQLRADRQKRAKEHDELDPGRKKFVELAFQAADNYARNPGAYHYLAGGVANLIFLEPSPRHFRSDCSQFASSVQDAAGLPALGPNGPLWVSTYVMADYLTETDKPQPGDFGLYGPRHVAAPRRDLLRAAGPRVHRPRVAADRLPHSRAPRLLPQEPDRGSLMTEHDAGAGGLHPPRRARAATTSTPPSTPARSSPTASAARTPASTARRRTTATSTTRSSPTSTTTSSPGGRRRLRLGGGVPRWRGDVPRNAAGLVLPAADRGCPGCS